MGRPTAVAIASLALVLALGATRAHAQPGPPPVPPVPVPAENPLTAEKAVLGKILFWDEQLSSDDSVACGTCHDRRRGGREGRPGLAPGFDGLFGTADDVLGSPGVIRADESNLYEPDPVFGLDPQVTGRNAPSAIGAAFSPLLFWDGRATGSFENPQTGAISIAAGGALESQSVAPLLNDVEMSHAGRSWDDLVHEIEDAVPLALASDLPADVASALASNDDYPSLFAAAFGDPAITAERIAFALASYERTLVPDRTPWDAFNAGNPNALTPSQVAGLQAFRGTTCTTCHRPPLFSDGTFRNIGLRPPAEDLGRFEITGNPADRGRFKVPSLRNVGLAERFMHDGRLSTLREVVDFYLEANGQVQFRDNQDPLVQQIAVPPQAVPALVDFLANGLTDPRVAAGAPPFDQPTLSASLDACRDGLDNDGDGLVDLGDDPGCASAGDTTERSVALSCDDGLDNDDDGAADLADPDCAGSPLADEDGAAAPPPATPPGCASVARELAMLPPLWLLLRRRRRGAPGEASLAPATSWRDEA